MITPRSSLAVAILCLAFGTSSRADPICTGNCSIGTSVYVGSFSAGSGTLSILGGDTVFAGSEGFIGSTSGNTGTVTVSGAGSRMDIGGALGSQLFVGAIGTQIAGTGILNILNGGTVTSNAFNNAPNFGDARLYLGRGGVGTVNINSGGSLIVQDLNSFGVEDGIQLGLSTIAGPGTGTMNVDGTGSVVVRGNAAFINIGQAFSANSGPYAGTGALNVTNGANVLIDGTSGFAFLGMGRGGSSNGSVLVSGAGSRIDLKGDTAIISVSNDNQAAVGNTGVGVLHVTQNAVVTAKAVNPTNALAIGTGLGSGLVIVDNGGRIELDGAVLVSRNSATNNTQSGVLLINGSGVVSAPSTFVGNGTNSAINGILAGTGTLNSNVTVQKGGLVDPGLSPGTLTIDGDVTFDGGTLKIEVGGLNDGEFDVLNVFGQAKFVSGVVEFAFINDFVPTTGDSFIFLSAFDIADLSNASFKYSGLAEGLLFDISAVEGALSFEALNDGKAIAAIPEPSTYALMLAGLAAVGSMARRRSA